MFSIFGIVLLIYGFITRNDTVLYQKSLSHNVNLWMGALTLLFGATMLLLTRKKKSKT
jgi:LPXTG-motif cell wall-anchored protein